MFLKLSIYLIAAVFIVINGTALPNLKVSTAKKTASCPKNGQLSPDKRFCWFVSNAVADFVNAEMYCMSNYNGHLASVHSIFDNMMLVDVGKKYAAMYGNMFYIGGNRLQGDWSWTDGSLFNFNDWAEGEPASGQSRDCIAVDIAYGYWYAVNCFDEHIYVCQTPSLNNQPTTTTFSPSTWATTTNGIPCFYQNSSCQTVDVVFILDVSQSIDGNYFTNNIKSFVKKIGDAFHLLGDNPSSQRSSRIAVVEFASDVTTNLPLVTRTRANFDQLVDENVNYEWQGITNISLGLYQALNIFQTANPPSANTIAILMTDGVSTLDIKQTQPTAKKLKNSVNFFAGIGINGINGNDVSANLTNMGLLIGDQNLAFGNISAANDPTTGILAKALKAYPCTSCKFTESKKQGKIFT